MRSYTHLTLEQRYQIQALMKMGHCYQEIGDVIGVHKSTIAREVRRNQGRRGYRPQQAHRFTLSRRRTKTRRRIAADTWHCVNGLLKPSGARNRSVAGCARSRERSSVRNGSTNMSIAISTPRARSTGTCAVSATAGSGMVPTVGGVTFRIGFRLSTGLPWSTAGAASAIGKWIP